MPRGYYTKIFGPWNKGKKFSQETCKKMSIAQKERFAKNPNFIPWNKGLKLSENHRIRMINSLKGKPWSEKRRQAQIARQGKSYQRIKLYCRTKPLKPLIKNNKEYSPYWQKIRKQVYQRDGWICQECGVHCHNDKKIQCHHIDYDTTNNNFFNLITLCASCHMKTNFNKNDWKNYYKNIMEGRGLIILAN